MKHVIITLLLIITINTHAHRPNYGPYLTVSGKDLLALPYTLLAANPQNLEQTLAMRYVDGKTLRKGWYLYREQNRDKAELTLKRLNRYTYEVIRNNLNRSGRRDVGAGWNGR